VRYIIFATFIFLLTPGVVFAVVDSDSDGLNDDEEAIYHTDSNNSDTDGDGYFDGLEVKYDYSPHIGEGKRLNESDFDKDGLNDWVERWFHSDIGGLDTDKDGVSDFDEVMKGSSPAVFGTSTVFSRKIEVDRTVQRLYYFVDNIKVLNLPVSTGNPSTPTPAGEFAILAMRPFVDYVGVGYSYLRTPWNMKFKPGYYLHAAPWHNDFGKRTKSHGCVNMKTEDAELLYKYVGVGMAVTVTGTTPARFYVGT